MVQASLFDELPDAPQEDAKPAYDWACSVCQENTPHLFHGVRYCAEHHPDPGPYVKR